MPSSYQPITYSDFAALATLANSKLSPSTPYEFPQFAGSDQISSPTDIKPQATYGSGLFLDGSKTTLWLFPYRTIAGSKVYTWSPVVKAFVGLSGSGNYTMQWDWTNPSDTNAPEGYIATVPMPSSPAGFIFYWKDIGNVATLTEDGTFTGWTLDDSYQDLGANNLPCGHGIWLKIFNRIRKDFLTSLTLFGGSTITFNDTFLLSGPWCVSTGQKCYFTLNSQAIYKNLVFVHSSVDTTGNMLASEAGMSGYMFALTGGNNINFDVPGTLNGQIILFSNPPGQSASDWALSSTPSTGITATFVSNYNDTNFPPSGRIVTAMVFDLVDVPYSTGTPIVLTATPSAGGTIINDGFGGRIEIVFTGAFSPYTETDTTVLDYRGITGKSAALVAFLADITFTPPSGSDQPYASHYRASVNGVFIANTLPTMGINPYIDVDLPQYNPQPTPDTASSRRIPMDASQPYIASVNNRAALWPVLRDTDFTPDSVFGQPFRGSKAWNDLIPTKYVQITQTSDSVPPSVADSLYIIASPFVPLGSSDIRFLSTDPTMTVYVKGGDFPTISDFDATFSGQTWASMAALVPGFVTDTTWYMGILNPLSHDLPTTADIVVIVNGDSPNGTFFPTSLNHDNQAVPQLEGYTYHFVDGDHTATQFPIPLQGYAVISLTVARQSVDTGAGVFVSPSTGTSALQVNVGTMQGFGWGSAGTFTLLQAITIPAGQSSITVEVFWPVTGGTPLAYNCTEQVMIRVEACFQPMLHSEFLPQTDSTGANLLGYYDGNTYYNTDRALMFSKQGLVTQVILLPVAAVVLNDLTACLNLLP